MISLTVSIDACSINVSSNSEVLVPFLLSILGFYFGNILNSFNQKGGIMKTINAQILNLLSSIFFTISGVGTGLAANGLTP
ncbi:MAG: hypothetical protein U5N85_18595 [Arcicella sp.]|nr:hypothetical protein [Arcicella sp.]